MRKQEPCSVCAYEDQEEDKMISMTILQNRRKTIYQKQYRSWKNGNRCMFRGTTDCRLFRCESGTFRGQRNWLDAD